MDRRDGRRIRPDRRYVPPGSDASASIARPARSSRSATRSTSATCSSCRAGGRPASRHASKTCRTSSRSKGIAGTDRARPPRGHRRRGRAGSASRAEHRRHLRLGRRRRDGPAGRATSSGCIYENIWQVGMTAPQASKVLAAELMVGGKRQTAPSCSRTRTANGGVLLGRRASRRRGLPALSGRVHGDQLRSFSLERFHPIRREWRPHYGVDLAAPQRHARARRRRRRRQRVGLGEIGARADGRHRSHGRRRLDVRAHLSAFAPGGRAPGRAIERGQVIGYVGSTGLSTGPHLHYELTREGVHVDPLEFTCDREPSITLTLAATVRPRPAGSRPAARRRSPERCEPTSLLVPDVAPAARRSRPRATSTGRARVSSPIAGASARIPRTRSRAFAAGLAAGADRLELDVHATADGARRRRCTTRRSTGRPTGTGPVRSLPLAAGPAARRRLSLPTPTADVPHRGAGHPRADAARAPRRAPRRAAQHRDQAGRPADRRSACSPTLDRVRRARAHAPRRRARTHHGARSAPRAPDMLTSNSAAEVADFVFAPASTVAWTTTAPLGIALQVPPEYAGHRRS